MNREGENRIGIRKKSRKGEKWEKESKNENKKE